MIALAQDRVAGVHKRFVALLPQIRRQAAAAFRSRRPEEREDLVQEVIADAYVAFTRLVELGKADLAYASPLAAYGVRHVCAGRRVGSSVHRCDVLSPANRRVTVEPLQRFDHADGQWKEVLVEDKHAGPAETAAARLDVAKWLRKLPAAKRRVARVLAAGETTKATAKQFGLSNSRVSQLRRELQASWQVLQGEPVTT